MSSSGPVVVGFSRKFSFWKGLTGRGHPHIVLSCGRQMNDPQFCRLTAGLSDGANPRSGLLIQSDFLH